MLGMLAGVGGQWANDAHTETGRECRDQVDNDGDNTIDCDDPDCAQICDMLLHPMAMAVSLTPPPDPTCFTADSPYTAQRCCDVRAGRRPGGDPTCWGDSFTFARCCPRGSASGVAKGSATESGVQCRDGLDNDNDGVADCDDPDCQGRPVCLRPAAGPGGFECSVSELSRITSSYCPEAADASHRTPSTCPAECAVQFSPWYSGCEHTPAVHRVDQQLGGQLATFAAMCAAAAPAAAAEGERCVIGSSCAAGADCPRCGAGMTCEAAPGAHGKPRPCTEATCYGTCSSGH